MVYKIRENIDINDLIDGRTFLYLSQQLKFNRENLAKIIKGQRSCTYDRAKDIVNYCKPNDTVEQYFIKVEKEG